MKNFKKAAVFFGVASAALVFGQQTGSVNTDNPSMKNMIKIGISGGPAISSNSHSAAFGLDLNYQHLVTPGFGLGLSTGYTHYFGKDESVFMSPGVIVESNDVGVVPVAALLRVYPKNWGVYFGTDLGYGVLLGDNRVATNVNAPNRPNGGLYLKPEIGYHNRDWNFSIHLQKVFTGTDRNYNGIRYDVSHIGAGISYNIPLGN